MRYQQRLSASLRTIALCLPCLAGGCSFYIHDGDLQTKTAKVLETYKTADVIGAMKTAVENQKKLDAAEIDAVVALDTADREYAIAQLIEPGPALPRPASASADNAPLIMLQARIQQRLQELVGDPKLIVASDWVDYRDKSTGDKAVREILQQQVGFASAAYKREGGNRFKSCDDFPPEWLPSAAVAKARGDLADACDHLANLESTPIPNLDRGEVGATARVLTAVKATIDSEKKNQDAAIEELGKAKDAVDAAAPQQGPVEGALLNALGALEKTLNQLDEASGLTGGALVSPGKALATIEFRKTNLRALIAAAADPDADAGSDSAQSIAAVISGLAKLQDIEAGKVPSLAKLSVVLAAQQGLERTTATELAGLRTKAQLLEDMREAQYREIELLALGMDSAEQARRKANASGCGAMTLGRILVDHACADVEPDAARALTAYNLSWVSGQRAEKVDDRKLTQLIQIQKLRLSQEAAEARANVLKVAISELATFGAGGVKPETIAAFLQALGLTAVAVGVN